MDPSYAIAPTAPPYGPYPILLPPFHRTAPSALAVPSARPVVIANNWYELAMVTPRPPPVVQTLAQVPRPAGQPPSAVPGGAVMRFVDGQNWHELNMLRGAVIRVPKTAPAAAAPNWDLPVGCEPSPLPHQVQVLHAQLDSLNAQQKVTLLSQQVF
eukprot:EG_transcript_23687